MRKSVGAPTAFSVTQRRNSHPQVNIKKIVAIGTTLFVNMLVTPTPPAQAGTATAPLSVTAIVGAVWSLSTSAVSVGSYDPIGANASAPLHATGSISDTCGNGLAGTITLDAGTVRLRAPVTDRRFLRWVAHFSGFSPVRQRATDPPLGCRAGEKLRRAC